MSDNIAKGLPLLWADEVISEGSYEECSSDEYSHDDLPNQDDLDFVVGLFSDDDTEYIPMDISSEESDEYSDHSWYEINNAIEQVNQHYADQWAVENLPPRSVTPPPPVEQEPRYHALPPSIMPDYNVWTNGWMTAAELHAQQERVRDARKRDRPTTDAEDDSYNKVKKKRRFQ